MTEKLYDQDAYAVEVDAKVISCEAYQEKKESGYHVILDRTLFFPEEGGQSPDKGTIDGIEVTDVQIKKDVITHSLKEPLAVGETVHGSLTGHTVLIICSSIPENIFFPGLCTADLDMTMSGFI